MLFFHVNAHGIIYVLQIKCIKYSKLNAPSNWFLQLCIVTETILNRPTIYFN